MKISSVDIAQLHERFTNNDHIDRMKWSITICGIVSPILITESGKVLDGNVRVAAARTLNISKIVAIVLTDVEALAYEKTWG